MSSEKAAAGSAELVVAPSRLTPKLMVVAAAATLLLVTSATGAALWLWPTSPEPAEAKAVRLAARRAAAVASAAEQAEPAVAAASPACAAREAAAAHRAQATESAAEPAAAAEAPLPRMSPPATAEASLDRLQRRLGEVLGAKGALEAAGAGELRLLTRGDHMVPVRHGDTSTADGGGAHERAAHAAHWSYSGMAGPQAWGRLKSEFSQCTGGQRQSPIDIRNGIALDLEPVQFDYQPSNFAVIDNGHTVQVNMAPGNSIEVNGRRYALLQFHFHRPSEERINGRQFEMDAHLVHKDGEGRLAVVAVLLERGAAQPLLQTVWNNLPLQKNEEFAARGQIDLNQLLPADRRYYTYMGSLTTPPCSEGVLWLVMRQPLTLSAQQIDIFSRLYPMNARPVQQAAGRIIKQAN